MSLDHWAKKPLVCIGISALFFACAPLPNAMAEPQAGQPPRPLTGSAPDDSLPLFEAPQQTIDLTFDEKPPPSLRRDTLVVLPAVSSDTAISEGEILEFDDKLAEKAAVEDFEFPPETADFALPADFDEVHDFAEDLVESVAQALVRSLPTPTDFRRDIRVGLSFNTAKLTLKCQTKCRLHTDKKYQGHGSGTISVQVHGGALRITSSQGKTWQAKSLAWINDDASRENYVEINKKKYRGTVELRPQGGKILVVNQLPVELYLQGVVPGEIGRLDSSMFAALESQAVAARTYAYRHFGSRQSLGFDVFDDTRDQVYQGLSGEAALPNQAVRSTAGVVMLHNQQLINAYYLSTCGGHTADLQTWGQNSLSYLQAVPDVDEHGKAWCQASSYSNWSFTYTWEQLSRIVKTHLSKGHPDTLINFNRISNVVILAF